MATTIVFTVTGNCNYAIIGGRGVYGKNQTFSFTKQELQDNADLRKSLVEAMNANILTASIGGNSINAEALQNIDESTEDIDISGLQGQINTLSSSVTALQQRINSGTVSANNASSVTVTFNPALTYSYTPVAYTGDATKYVTHISNISGNGFTIHLSENYTGTVYWTIVKRS